MGRREKKEVEEERRRKRGEGRNEGGKKGREVLGWYGIRNEHLSIESL